jgi:hypothetical protein
VFFLPCTFDGWVLILDFYLQSFSIFANELDLGVPNGLSSWVCHLSIRKLLNPTGFIQKEQKGAPLCTVQHDLLISTAPLPKTQEDQFWLWKILYKYLLFNLQIGHMGILHHADLNPDQNV